jgi:replicative DNA helicase
VAIRSDMYSTYTVDVLARMAERMAEVSGAPSLIVLDYLQLMSVPAELRVKDTRERVSYVAGRLQVTLARGLGCPVLALSSVGRAAYCLDEADLEGRLAAFMEAGELEYTAYTALLLYDLPEAVQASLNLSPGLLGHFRPMALDLCKNREGRTGRVAAKWEAEWGVWRDAQTSPSETSAGRF